MDKSDNESLLHSIVERIVERFRPERVILFGSYARGTATVDSDADLLIVMDVKGSKRTQAVEIDLLLEGIPIPLDIIVATPDDVDRYRDSPGNVIREAMCEGRVLYEHAA